MGKRDNLWRNDAEGLRKSPAQRLSSLRLGDPQNFITGVFFLKAKTPTLCNTLALGESKHLNPRPVIRFPLIGTFWLCSLTSPNLFLHLKDGNNNSPLEES